MNRHVVPILIFCASVPVLLTLFLWSEQHPHARGPLFRPGWSHGPSVQVYVFKVDNGFVLSDHVVRNSSDDRPIARWGAGVVNTLYPLEWFAEWIAIPEVIIDMDELEPIPINRPLPEFDQHENQQLHEAMIAYLRSDDELSRFHIDRPGPIALTPLRALFGLLIMTPIFLGSGFITCGYIALRDKLAERRVQQRLESDMCVHCGYAMRDLDNSICPECGSDPGTPQPGVA